MRSLSFPFSKESRLFLKCHGSGRLWKVKRGNSTPLGLYHLQR